MAIKKSISVLSFGIRSCLSFEIGEKQVSTVFRSDRSLGTVVRPSTEPETIGCVQSVIGENIFADIIV